MSSEFGRPPITDELGWEIGAHPWPADEIVRLEATGIPAEIAERLGITYAAVEHAAPCSLFLVIQAAGQRQAQSSISSRRRAAFTARSATRQA